MGYLNINPWAPLQEQRFTPMVPQTPQMPAWAGLMSKAQEPVPSRVVAGQGMPDETLADYSVAGTPVAPDDDWMNKIMSGAQQRVRLTPDQLKGFSDQQLDVDKLRKIADDYAGAQAPVNLSGVAAGVDALTGSKFANAYQAPPSAEERQAKQAALRKLAVDAQQGITKDQMTLELQKQKSEDAVEKAALMGYIQQHTPVGLARINAQIQSAADAIHKAPNMKLYVDKYNQIAENQALLDHPHVTMAELNEAMQNLTGAIGRSNVMSDFRLKELSQPTLQAIASKGAAFVTADPHTIEAPADILKLYKEMGQRIFDQYEAAIGREANRVSKGREKHMVIPGAKKALIEARDFYTSGAFGKEARTRMGLPGSTYGTFNKPETSIAAAHPQDKEMVAKAQAILADANADDGDKEKAQKILELNGVK